jgi:hypothetical protein
MVVPAELAEKHQQIHIEENLGTGVGLRNGAPLAQPRMVPLRNHANGLRVACSDAY